MMRPRVLSRSRTGRFLGIACVVLLAGAAWLASIRPSHDRDWVAGQQRMPRADYDGATVTIRNVRDFRYADDGRTVEERYEDRVYDLERISSVWYMLVPFSSDWRGPAHSFLSFGFDDGRFLSISVEARRERGEEYSMLRGLVRRYEIMYVVGDERDLVSVRALRGDIVHAYPIRTSPEKMRAVLTAMLDRVNELDRRPEFYNTLTNNCTTSLLRHANDVADRRIPWGWRVLLPGYSDELALRYGLVDTDLPVEEARRRFDVTERVARHLDADDFSLLIRTRL